MTTCNLEWIGLAKALEHVHACYLDSGHDSAHLCDCGAARTLPATPALDKALLNAQLADVNGTGIAAALSRIEALLIELRDALPKPAPLDAPFNRDAMQQRADYNRDHAEELFGNDLVFDPLSERWITRDDGRKVVFTMYGWLREIDIEKRNDNE